MKTRFSFLSFIIAFVALGFLLPAYHASAYTLTQQDYRWYVNEDAQTETDPWPAGATDLAEDTPITSNDSPPATGDSIRLRMNIAVSDGSLNGNEVFKLQWAQTDICSSAANKSWHDLNTSNNDWVGYDNATPTDDDTLDNSLLSSTNIKESYQEANNANTPNIGLDGELIEYDWSIQGLAAVTGAHYCFRMVKVEEGAQPLNAYNDFPQLDMAQFIAVTQNWKWYGDEDQETPTSALSAENVQPIGVRDTDPVKLRITVNNITSLTNNDLRYVLRYDTAPDFSNAQMVQPNYLCGQSAWCYADGIDTDDDVISTLLLSDSDTFGRHNEDTGASTFAHGPNQAAEMEFTIKSTSAEAGTPYYFDLYDMNDNVPVEVNVGDNSPTLITRAPVLTFSYEAVDIDTAIGSYTTNIASTVDGVDFGRVLPGQDYIAAHLLRVYEDGLGYQVSVHSEGTLQNALGQTINDFPAANNLPTPWSFVESATTTGAFGYHTTDGLLSNGSTRFASDDTWAGFSETPGEIIYTEGTVTDDVHDILYRLNIGTAQAPLTYSTDIFYVVTGTF